MPGDSDALECKERRSSTVFVGEAAFAFKMHSVAVTLGTYKWCLQMFRL